MKGFLVSLQTKNFSMVCSNVAFKALCVGIFLEQHLALRPPHTSRFFVGRQKILTFRLVCGEFRQVCDKIAACRAISDSARSQNVLSGLVG